MRKPLIISLIASTALVAPSVHAQESEVALLRIQIDALEAQLAALSARLDEVESQPQATPIAPEQVPAGAIAPAPGTAPKDDGIAIGFGGAPEIEGEGGWSFKPFGRIQVDAGFTDLPEGLAADDGFGSELRRVRLGASGDLPGGLGYKIEVDFAGNAIDLTDAFITYGDDGLTLTAGQHNTFQGLEELTSSRFSTFIERAAFTDAFGFERRVGVSAQHEGGDVLLQAGAFSANSADLPGSKSWSLDGRAVFAPKLGGNQLHLGGSVHLAELETGESVRYRQRPLVHFTSERLVSTGTIGATSEFGLGAEAALISGPFHAAGEVFRQSVDRTGPLVTDPTFFGGYAEIGYFLTGGDSRGYKGFKFDRTRPASPIGEGGIGAIQVNLRYDHLDLDDADAGILGGTQDGYFASLVWVPTDYTLLMINYGRLQYEDAVLALPSGDTSYGADVVAMRAQVDF